MPYINVDVDLDDIDTDDLIQELILRGYDRNTYGVDIDEAFELLENIHQLRRTGENYQTELDKLIYSVLGKIA
jgi:hypothetical protein